METRVREGSTVLDAITAIRDSLRLGIERSRVAGPVVLAVSGGADSVALHRGIVELRSKCGLEPVVAHLDHGLQADSANVAEWVRALAVEHGLRAVIERRDLQAISTERGLGLEETARDERYRFLADTGRAVGADAVLVAHTSDDQAETVLHHLVRGTGLAGLRGMPRERSLGEGVRLVRPLLGVSRSAVQAYLDALGQPYREDPSNVDPRFTRNRIRSKLLPMLEADFNPRVREAILRLAEQAGGASDVVASLAIALLDSATITADENHVTLDIAPLAAEPHDHVLRALFVELWRRRDWPRKGIGFDDWQRCVDLARNGDAISLSGGIEVRRHGEVLHVTRRESLSRG